MKRNDERMDAKDLGLTKLKNRQRRKMETRSKANPTAKMHSSRDTETVNGNNANIQDHIYSTCLLSLLANLHSCNLPNHTSSSLAISFFLSYALIVSLLLTTPTFSALSVISSPLLTPLSLLTTTCNPHPKLISTLATCSPLLITPLNTCSSY